MEATDTFRLIATSLAGCLMAIRAIAGTATPLTFRKHVVDAAFPAISAVAVDVDGDGLLDIVAAGGPSGARSPWCNLIVWYRAPDWQKRSVAVLDQPDDILLHLEDVDFQRRGGRNGTAPEVASVSGGKVRWHRYDREAGSWTSRVVVADAPYAHGCAAGDIDGDGYMDLLVPSQPTASRGGPDARRGVLWARNPGVGAWTQAWPQRYLADRFDIDGWLHYVRLADLNGDGKLDALLGSQHKTGWFGFWLQPSDLAGDWTFHRLEGVPRGGTNLDAADLNGDGRPDLVGTLGHGTGLLWFPAPAYAATPLDDTLKSPHCLALADFDGDGRTDVFSCGYESREAALFQNRGGGTFAKHVVDADQCAYDARVTDLNADGRPDILVAGQLSTNLVWYENLGPSAARVLGEVSNKPPDTFGLGSSMRTSGCAWLKPEIPQPLRRRMH